MKNLKVVWSQDDPREGKTLNDWYRFIVEHENKRLNVHRNMQTEHNTLEKN